MVSKLRFLVIPYATQRHPIQTKNRLKGLQQNIKAEHRLAATVSLFAFIFEVINDCCFGSAS